MTRDRDAAWWRTLRTRLGTAAGVQVVPVPAGTATLPVTFRRAEPDARYAVLATPTWNTTVWVTSATPAGCTLHVGTPPGADATVPLLVVREG